MMDYGTGWGLGALGWLALLLSWVVPVFVTVAAVKYLFFPGTRSADKPPQAAPAAALRILEERYARGEIEREEFQQKRADLMQR